MKTRATQQSLQAGRVRDRACSTVGNISKKNADKIRSFASIMESMAISKKEQKVMHCADDGKLDEAVYLCFVQKSTQDVPISRPILSEKVALLPESPFQASQD